MYQTVEFHFLSELQIDFWTTLKLYIYIISKLTKQQSFSGICDLLIYYNIFITVDDYVFLTLKVEKSMLTFIKSRQIGTCIFWHQAATQHRLSKIFPTHWPYGLSVSAVWRKWETKDWENWENCCLPVSTKLVLWMRRLRKLETYQELRLSTYFEWINQSSVSMDLQNFINPNPSLLVTDLVKTIISTGYPNILENILYDFSNCST